MSDVILKKDGFYLQEWNGDKRGYDVTKLKGIDWILEWESPIQLEGTITFQDIFDQLRLLDTPELALFAKLAEAGGLSAYIEEAYEPVKERVSSLDYIEVHRYVELSWYKREGLPTLENYVCAVGRVNAEPGGHYAYDFTPVNQLMHCEIHLDSHAYFHDERDMYNDKGEWAYPAHEPPFDNQDDPNAWPTVNGKPCDCVRCVGEMCESYIRLGEFFWALFDDIAFHGNPTQRDERFDELIEIKDKVLSGEMKTVPFDPDDELLNQNR